MTRDHQYTAEYHDTTKILQSAPQPSTIYCLVVRCLRILGGFHGFQGGTVGIIIAEEGYEGMGL